jgi:hypothetical protein
MQTFAKVIPLLRCKSLQNIAKLLPTFAKLVQSQRGERSELKA